MPSDFLTVAFGATCAGLGALGSTVVAAAVAHRRERRHAGHIEVARKRQLDIYEAQKELAGHLANVHHQIAWVSRADADAHPARIEQGRDRAARARELARTEIANLGPDVLRAVLRATDTAEALFAAASAGEPTRVIIVHGRRWREQANAVTRMTSTAVQAAEVARLEREWHASDEP